MSDTNTTPLHSIYTNTTCPCEQCQQGRNAQTAILPRFDRPAPTSLNIVEIFTAIDAETGGRVTYYWPIQRQY
jgi:hypothetical protein